MANANDPNWLAYQRALGLETSEVQRRTSVATDEANRRRDFQVPIVQQEAKLGERDIATARANAGLYDSSFTQELLAEQKRRELNQVAGIHLDTQSQLAGLQSQSALDIAKVNREAAERALQLGISVA